MTRIRSSIPIRFPAITLAFTGAHDLHAQACDVIEDLGPPPTDLRKPFGRLVLGPDGDDVACPTLFAAWIAQLYAEQITAGCAGPP